MSDRSVLKVADLRPGFNHVNLVARVISVERSRDDDNRAFLEIGDETGRTKLVVYGKPAESFKRGSVVQVKNGFVSRAGKLLYLNAGEYSSVEISESPEVPPLSKIPNRYSLAPPPRPSWKARRWRGRRRSWRATLL